MSRRWLVGLIGVIAAAATPAASGGGGGVAGPTGSTASAGPGKVVVEQHGYLVAISLDGSQRVRLAKRPGRDAAISPDGSMVAFATNKGISTMRIDGSHLRAVTRGDDGHPSWSADGRSLFFVRYFAGPGGEECGAIFSLAGSGGGPHRIIAPGKTGHSYEDPSVSPHGTRIAFSDWNACAGGTSSPRLRVVDLNGHPTSDLKKLPRNGYYPNPEHSCPAWSPDGTQIAYRHNSDLAVANRDGSNERILIKGHGFLEYEAPAWSPDGAWIAFARGTDSGFIVEAVHPDGSGRRVIARPRRTGSRGPIAGWLPARQKTR